jgi:flagellar biosynthesis/type III secretory pathway protein FliH
MRNLIGKQLVVVGCLAVLTACNSGGGGSDRYQEGFDAGYDQGYDDGYSDGDADGYERARVFFQSQDYTRGFSDGQAYGFNLGYTQGYDVGKVEGISIGRTQGYDTGYNDGYTDGFGDGEVVGYNRGYDDGYDDGRLDGSDPGAITAAYNNGYNDGYTDGYVDGDAVGYSDGYNDGYDDGAFDGYDIGYTDGFDDGYVIGYDDGFYDGSGFSTGSLKVKTQNAQTKMLNSVYKGIVDMSKIPKIKSTSKGLVAGGKLIFEETSLGVKDLQTRAAIAERFKIQQMAGQIQKRFALESFERSVQIAKIANHWAKFSSSRAMTADDAQAFTEELAGSDLTTIGQAYKAAIKGDASLLDNVIQNVAMKNKTSVANASLIMSKLFAKK